MQIYEFPASTFFSAAANFNKKGARGLDLIGAAEIAAPIDAVALSPLSEVPRALAYFDNDPVPELLVFGRVVARPGASRVRLAPVMPCSFPAGPVEPYFAPQLPLHPGVLRVDAWRGVVPATAAVPRTTSIQQERLVLTDPPEEQGLLFFQAACPRTIRVWASNEGTRNPGGDAVVRLIALRPEVAGGVDPRAEFPRGRVGSYFASGEEILSFTLPGDPDDGNCVGATTINPGCLEAIVAITPPDKQPLTVACGVEIGW